MLVVDDDYQVLQIIRLILEDAGYRVLVSSNAQDALAQLAGATVPVDLAVIDVNMPGLDGRQLAARVSNASPSTRILYVSGDTTAELRDHGVVDDNWLLRKPFSHAELLSRVAERLQG